MSNSGTQNGISRHKNVYVMMVVYVKSTEEQKAKGEKSIPKVKVIFLGFQNQQKIDLQHENKA